MISEYYDYMSIISLQLIFFTKTTAWKVSKYEAFSGSYFSTLGPEKTLYLDDFHAVNIF